MINSDKIIEEGFTELLTDDSEFHELINELGEIKPSRINGPEIDLIKPKTKESAHPHSLSANYGINSLPFHTDGAYFKIPPKFIVLRCLEIPSNESTPTVLINPLEDISEENLDWLKYETWKVKFRTGTFYTSIVNYNLADENIIRFDPVCMSPVYNDEAPKRLSNIFKRCLKTRIEWEVGKTIILNNWKLLHARPAVKRYETKTRKLQRVMII